MELNGYRLLLPEGTLDYFDLVDVKESVNEVVIYLEDVYKRQGLKGSPTNVFKSFTPPQKGAGTMLKGDDTAAQLACILAKKHLI